MNDLATQLGAQDLEELDRQLGPEAPTCLDIMLELRALRLTVHNLERNIMSDFDQLFTEVESQGGMLAELAKVVATVHDHMTASSAGDVIAPATQTKINNAMAMIMANRTALAAALEKMQTAAAMAVAASSESVFTPKVEVDANGNPIPGTPAV